MTDEDKSKEQLLSELNGLRSELSHAFSTDAGPDRCRAEDVLKLSAERFRLVFDQAPIGMAISALDYRLLRVNEAFCRIIGYSREELQSFRFIDFTHPDDVEANIQEIQNIVRGEVDRSQMTKRYIRKDGEIVWVKVSMQLMKGRTGQPICFLSMIEDITAHKKAEEERRRSEERLRLASDAVGLGVFEWNVSTDLLIWGNRRVCEILGCPFESGALSRTDFVEDILYPDDAGPFESALTAAMQPGGTFSSTCRICRKSTGELRWVEFSGRFELTPEGAPIRLNGVFTDVTERRRMEEELRGARDYLDMRVRERTAELVKASETLREQAALLDLSTDAIFVRNLNDRVVFWNKGAEETFGITREQAIGKIAHELLHTKFVEPLQIIIQKTYTNGHWEGELAHQTPTGREIIVESRWALQTDINGKPAGFLEINRDITSRKHAEELLRRADRAFKTLSECNQALVRETEEQELLHRICRTIVEVGGYRMAWVGFMEYDENKFVRPVAHAGHDEGYLSQTRITWADTERGRGPTGRAARDGTVNIARNALTSREFSPWRAAALERGFASSIALPVVANGRPFGVLTIYAPEPDAFDDEEVSFLSSLAENLSYGIVSIRTRNQRNRAVGELRRHSAKLELMNQELQEFAFVASHDLQEPLRKIRMFSDRLRSGYEDRLDELGKDYLLRMENAAGRMQQLITELLKYSRVATKPGPFSSVDLTAVLDEVLQIFELRIKTTNAKVETSGLPSVEAEPTQMKQLLQNLVGNALKFQTTGNTPHLKIRSTIETGNICRIFVEDNGIGFDEKYLDRIFAPFQRLHTRTEFEGSGMGLAICRKIVERHHGSIAAKSEMGKGSTFIVTLPLKQSSSFGD